MKFRDARQLLDAARAAALPSAEQRASADAALRARLAEHGIDGLPPLGEMTASEPGRGPSAPGAALKLAAAAAVAIALIFGVRAMWPASPRFVPTRMAPDSRATPRAPDASRAPLRNVPEPEPSPAPEASTQAPLPAMPDRPALPLPTTPQSHRHTAVDDSALQAELHLIGSANALLQDGRYSEALRVLATHAQGFPHGVLRAEREGLRVLALCGTAADDRALREREHYLRTAPSSPLTARVRAACKSAADAGR